MPTDRSLSGLIVLLLLLLSGCAQDRTSTFAELGPEANTKGFGEQYPPGDEADGDFIFGVGDTVGILVQNNPDLSGTFIIRIDGKITMNVLGDLQVAGLTPEQVRHKLESKVGVYVKGEVQITVTATTIVSKRFYVAALNPLTGGYIVRAVPFKGDTTLFEVWAGIGSTSTSLDDETHIKVIRPDPRHPVVKVINIREMLFCGYSGGNIRIKPNDIVFVPPTIWGRFNQLTTAIAAPFTGFFNILGTYGRVGYLAQTVTGGGNNSRYGGSYLFGGSGGGLGNQNPGFP